MGYAKRQDCLITILARGIYDYSCSYRNSLDDKVYVTHIPAVCTHNNNNSVLLANRVHVQYDCYSHTYIDV